MRTYTLLIVVAVMVLASVEARRPRGQKKNKAFYGPVKEPSECEAKGRTSKIIMTSDMSKSELCSAESESFCLCMSPKNRNGGRGGRGRGRKNRRNWRRNQRRNGRKEAVEDEAETVDAFTDVDFVFKCGMCKFKWDWRSFDPTESDPNDVDSDDI